jgi:FkbM family methyltransferase
VVPLQNRLGLYCEIPASEVGDAMGSQLIYYGRRLASELWLLIAPRYRLRVGSRSICAPGYLREASRLVRDWQTSWKTEVLRQHINARPGVFIDVGTNIGMTLLDFIAVADDERQYIGFEPNPASARMISALIETNKLTNASLVAAGLSNRSGLFELSTRAGHPSDSAATLLEGVRPGWSYERQWVSCFRFSDIADDMKLDAISFIKIDVEGAELLVLQGMKERLMRDRPAILCEVLHRDKDADPHAYSMHLSEIEALLAEISYSIFRIDGKNNLSAISYSTCSAFPDVIYTKDSDYLCDYLLMPSERQMRMTRLRQG